MLIACYAHILVAIVKIKQTKSTNERNLLYTGFKYPRTLSHLPNQPLHYDI